MHGNQELYDLVKNFETTGQILVNGTRNLIKIFPYQGKTINIKSFKKPLLINAIIYKYFRKSKAKRSYENANILLDKGIGTPKPIAFYENFNNIFLRNSYYICEHLEPDFVFKNVIENPSDKNMDKVLRGIAQFTFNLHENGIEFLDHSPGNTLVKRNQNQEYEFFLVDLNRMKFHQKMSLELRLSNLRKLTPSKEMIAVISNEYAKLYHKPEAKIFDLLWKNTQKFQQQFMRKQNFKKKFIFWK